ncbi:MAG: TRAP transporter substrate-binding protein, partial [Alphaproteobacteria bacterium]|nr:TRAP transporter substrate-binding protein [Alphaproteobacteria bacterium]
MMVLAGMKFGISLSAFSMRRGNSRRMRVAFKSYLPFVLVVLAGFAVAAYFVRPAPPSSIRMATGAPGGTYAALGEQYKAALAVDGIEVELVESSGSLDNLRRLTNDEQSVDIAFLQGGIGNKDDHPNLVSLASLYPEPLWLFVRADKRPSTSRGFAGFRIAIGAKGSGTSDLVRNLLSLSYDDDALERHYIGGEQAAKALVVGDIDAAAFVGGYAPVIRDLVTTPGIELAALPHTQAFSRLYQFLSVETLPEGIIDPKKNIPPGTVSLLATTANLVAHDDLHPAIASLLLQAARKIHGGGGLFSAPGEFPSPRYADFPVSDDAARYFDDGPGFLHQYLPFWAANLVQRLIVLLIPIATVLLPFVRFAPPFLRWRVRRRIYRWYENVRVAEAAARADPSDVGRVRIMETLDELQAEVGSIEVPLGYTDQLYQLRLHIRFVRQVIENEELAATV